MWAITFSLYHNGPRSPRCTAATTMSCHSPQRNTRRPNTKEPGRAAHSTGHDTDMATACGQRRSDHSGPVWLAKAGMSRHTNHERVSRASTWRVSVAAARWRCSISSARMTYAYTIFCKSSGHTNASANAARRCRMRKAGMAQAGGGWGRASHGCSRACWERECGLASLLVAVVRSRFDGEG